MRWTADTPVGLRVRETLEELDLVFYQSEELKALGAKLLGTSLRALPEGKHIVQSRGVIEPEVSPDDQVRHKIRARLDLTNEHVVILYLGRIVQEKGLFELVDVFAERADAHPDVVLVLLGAIPECDDTRTLEKRLRSLPNDRSRRIKIVPACPPDRIWDYFKAADLFAFPSLREGMPNSLLEAVLGGLPAVAFSIPAVHEITRFGRALLEVRPHDFASFVDVLFKLAYDPALRKEFGERGRAIAREHFSLQKNMRTVTHHLQKLSSS